MRPETASNLLALNKRFYETYGPSFAATRRRVQPGIVRVLTQVSPRGQWLDLGCGSGALAAWWQQHVDLAQYQGLDFSQALLDEARQVAPGIPFAQADLLDPYWQAGLTQAGYDGVLCFAVLHHLPGFGNRLRLMRQVHDLLRPKGTFIQSVWQFQHSPRLMSRIQPWSLADVDENDLEPGDTLLDWRQNEAGVEGEHGLRYVHLFDRHELEALAETAGFKVVDQFESDGHGGRLGFYQVWRSTAAA